MVDKDRRCIVPATSFCEYEDTKPRKTPIQSRETASAASDWSVVDAGPIRAYDLLGDAQKLLALVATLKQPPQCRRRVLQALLYVDLVLEFSRLHPAGERADRLRSARHVVESR